MAAGTKTGRRVVARKGAKGPGGKKAGSPAAKSNGSAKASSSRRSHEDLVKLVPAIVKLRKAGKSWDDVKDTHGVNGIVGRRLLAEAGYDAKGETLAVDKITGSGKSLAAKVAKARRGGAAWYTLALATGKTESELKALLTEHSHADEASGRVYTKSEAAGGR